MKAASIVSKRKTANQPSKLSAVPRADYSQRQIKFADSDLSLLGGLLTLATRLPKAGYDEAAGRERLDVNDEAKGHILEGLTSTSWAVTDAIMLIGKLLAGQDEKVGAIGHDEVRQLGYVIHGLGHIAQALETASFEITDSLPAEAANE